MSKIVDVTVKEAEKTSKASAIVIHTSEALEKHVMDELTSTFRRVYSIGPLPMLLNQVTDRSSNPVGGNIWQEEETCVQWLNSKKSNLVI
ncbi:hypothetical protein RJ639_008048 [Escallonia herrerae]|uniref:Uncharacterized protein n=1 Tax=Escallonia herrerae TaxID=1293975 RepID=A0AA89ARH9_9ASTE|nr:hypothetical protein RJ639_008048 [Escallonia herrerae]